MLPEIILIFSLIFIALGSLFTFGAGEALLITGGYLAVIAFTMAKSRTGE